MVTKDVTDERTDEISDAMTNILMKSNKKLHSVFGNFVFSPVFYSDSLIDGLIL